MTILTDARNETSQQISTLKCIIIRKIITLTPKIIDFMKCIKKKNYAKIEEMDTHPSSFRIPKLSSQNHISADLRVKTLTHMVKIIFQNQALSISFMNAAYKSFPLTYVPLPTPHSLKFMITSLIIILKCVCVCL